MSMPTQNPSIFLLLFVRQQDSSQYLAFITLPYPVKYFVALSFPVMEFRYTTYPKDTSQLFLYLPSPATASQHQKNTKTPAKNAKASLPSPIIIRINYLQPYNVKQ